MAIKVVEKMPEPQVNERMEALKSDIREIIEKRIPICEIVDPPYPHNSMRRALEKALKIVCCEWVRKKGLTRYLHNDRIFKIKSKKIENEVHWYVQFNVNELDRQVEDIRKLGEKHGNKVGED